MCPLKNKISSYFAVVFNQKSNHCYSCTTSRKIQLSTSKSWYGYSWGACTILKQPQLDCLERDELRAYCHRHGEPSFYNTWSNGSLDNWPHYTFRSHVLWTSKEPQHQQPSISQVHSDCNNHSLRLSLVIFQNFKISLLIGDWWLEIAEFAEYMIWGIIILLGGLKWGRLTSCGWGMVLRCPTIATKGSSFSLSFIKDCKAIKISPTLSFNLLTSCFTFSWLSTTSSIIW